MNSKTQGKRHTKSVIGIDCECDRGFYVCEFHRAAFETAAERDRLNEINAELLEASKRTLEEYDNLLEELSNLKQQHINNLAGGYKALKAAISKATGEGR